LLHDDDVSAPIDHQITEGRMVEQIHVIPMVRYGCGYRSLRSGRAGRRFWVPVYWVRFQLGETWTGPLVGLKAVNRQAPEFLLAVTGCER
jgi:hypothetical protein